MLKYNHIWLNKNKNKIFWGILLNNLPKVDLMTIINKRVKERNERKEMIIIKDGEPTVVDNFTFLESVGLHNANAFHLVSQTQCKSLEERYVYDSKVCQFGRTEVVPKSIFYNYYAVCKNCDEAHYINKDLMKVTVNGYTVHECYFCDYKTQKEEK